MGNGSDPRDRSSTRTNALAWLEGGRQDRTAHRAVIEVGLHCYPLSDYAIGPARPDALILGYAGVPAERMRPISIVSPGHSFGCEAAAIEPWQTGRKGRRAAGQARHP